MQPSYLRFAWLKTIEQSILRKQLIVKQDTSLLQFLAFIGNQLPPDTAFFVERNSCQA